MKKITRGLSLLLAVILLCAPLRAAAGSGKVLNYLVIGDSIAYGQGLTNPEKASYGAIVAHAEGYNYKNDAIGGSTTENLIDALGKAEVIADVRSADIISVSIGGNDFMLDNIPRMIIENQLLGKNDRMDEVNTVFRANFSRIIAMIRELNPTAVIITQTLYDPADKVIRQTFARATGLIGQCLDDYLKNAPGSIEIIDVASDFGTCEGLLADHVHPNAEGNLRIAQLTVDKLRQLGLGTAQTAAAEEPGQDVSFFVGMQVIMGIMFATMLRMIGVTANMLKLVGRG